jgi:hypothetical protein
MQDGEIFCEGADKRGAPDRTDRRHSLSMKGLDAPRGQKYRSDTVPFGSKAIEIL